MSIATEISRLQTAKANLKASIENKMRPFSLTDIALGASNTRAYCHSDRAVVGGETITVKLTDYTTYDWYLITISSNSWGSGTQRDSTGWVAEDGSFTVPYDIPAGQYYLRFCMRKTAGGSMTLDEANAAILELSVSNEVTGSISTYHNYIDRFVGEEDSNVITYTVSEGGTAINPLTGDTESTFKLVKKYKYLTSTQNAIEYGWFNGNGYLYELNIPSQIRTITSSAFYSCSNLRYVSGLENIESATGGAFHYCGNFKQPVYMPKLKGSLADLFAATGVTAIYSLGSIEALTTTSSGGYGTFYNCKSLTTANLPSTLKTLGTDAFHGCTALTTVNWEDITGVTTIRGGVFSGCSALVGEISFPNLTGTLGNEAFLGTKITKVQSLGSITTIAGGTSSGCFAQCTALTSVVLPNTLTSTGIRTFYGCTALTSCNFPTSLVRINQMSFQNTRITTLDLTGSSVMTLENDCFRQTTALTTVKLPKNTVLSNGFQFAEQGGNSYNATTAAALDYDIDLSDSETTTLSACTFYRSKIVRFTAPSGLTTIAGANSNRGVFEGSAYLLEVDLPSTLTTIGTRAFRDCTHMTTLTCRATTPPTFGSNALYNTSALVNIYVPADSVAAYKAASGWSGFASKISAITE